MRSLLLLLILPFSLAAQLGGSTAFRSLLLSPTGRITALGGTHVTLFEEDPGAQVASPSLLNANMHRQVSFSTAIYPGKANYGQLAYAHQFKIPGTFGWGVQYMAYGKMDSRDETGLQTGTFNANDVSIYTGYAYRFGKLFSAGANVRFLYAQLGNATSAAATADLGITIEDTAHFITATLVAKNIGGQFNSFGTSGKEQMPLDLQAGLSVGFRKFPLRFHLTLHNLLRWDIRYDNPADVAQDALFIDSSEVKSKKYIGDKLFRHAIFGVEVNIKKVVRIFAAYNHLRQQELKLSTRRGAPGLSFGLDVRVKQFGFTYAFQPLSQGYTLNQLSLRVNTAGFTKKKHTVVHEP